MEDSIELRRIDLSLTEREEGKDDDDDDDDVVDDVVDDDVDVDVDVDDDVDVDVDGGDAAAAAVAVDGTVVADFVASHVSVASAFCCKFVEFVSVVSVPFKWVASSEESVDEASG
jgi:hypothetical protein